MIERPTERLRYVVRHVSIQEHGRDGNWVRTEHVLQQLWQIIPEDRSGAVRGEWRDVPIEEENNDEISK